jgi:hypothetical protein
LRGTIRSSPPRKLWVSSPSLHCNPTPKLHPGNGGWTPLLFPCEFRYSLIPCGDCWRSSPGKALFWPGAARRRDNNTDEAHRPPAAAAPAALARMGAPESGNCLVGRAGQVGCARRVEPAGWVCVVANIAALPEVMDDGFVWGTPHAPCPALVDQVDEPEAFWRDAH